MFRIPKVAKKYGCYVDHPSCAGAIFQKKKSLVRHWEIIHSPNVLEFRCPIKKCNFKSNREDTIVSHLRHPKHRFSFLSAQERDEFIRQGGIPSYIVPNSNYICSKGVKAPASAHFPDHNDIKVGKVAPSVNGYWREKGHATVRHNVWEKEETTVSAVKLGSKPSRSEPPSIKSIVTVPKYCAPPICPKPDAGPVMPLKPVSSQKVSIFRKDVPVKPSSNSNPDLNSILVETKFQITSLLGKIDGVSKMEELEKENRSLKRKERNVDDLVKRLKKVESENRRLKSSGSSDVDIYADISSYSDSEFD